MSRGRVSLLGSLGCWTGALLGTCCSAAISVQINSAPAAPQPVGAPITWTATATDSDPGTIDYQFSGGKAGGALRMQRDFNVSNQYVWAVTDAEGSYVTQAIARNRSTGSTATVTATFQITSLVSGNESVISPTANPLVALYSAPACPLGSLMLVQFGAGPNLMTTNPAPCTGVTSMNFYVAGMLPDTTYSMSNVVYSSLRQHRSPELTFTTGPIDPTLAFPPFTIPRPADTTTSAVEGMILFDYLSPPGGPFYFPTAVDLQGRVLWYYPALGVPAQNTTYAMRPVLNSQGHLFLILNDPLEVPSQTQILREIDLAGNTVTETNASRVSEQLESLGKTGIIAFDHDAIRLPNGHTLVIASQEEMFPAGTQGATAPVDILGDAIVDLDENWQVAWSWSAYDQMDINRPAVLGETCAEAPGCPPLVLAPIANDWIHGNSLNYIPSDGNLLFSSRHQDWLLKIDYANGAGSGAVLWRLGKDGDFAITSADPYPWFSHQHDAEYQLGGTDTLAMFDNGNTRAAANPGAAEDSRGYVLQIDEANRQVTPSLLADLGVFSKAVGSAQHLENGDYFFEAGFVSSPQTEALAIEVSPNGEQNFQLVDLTQTYRAFRMNSMYSVEGDAAQQPRFLPFPIFPPRTYPFSVH